MPLRDSAPDGAPCWIDLMTTDQQLAKEFYGSFFGWTVDDPGPDYGGYINFLRDGVPVAGCMQSGPDDAMSSFWSVYLATKDAQSSVDAAEAHGAQVLLPAMDVMELGRMAVLHDPGQAAIGIWQPGLHAGFGVLDEVGAPSWFELLSRDYDASLDFYRDVFGWETRVVSDVPEFRYSTLGEEAVALAGVMDGSGFLPEGVPSHWRVYFKVDSTDAAVSLADELGGTVVRPAEDTPYGRLAEIADPTGGMFVIQGS